jgi:hypothetical protein
VVRRFMPCGKAGCRCQAHTPQLHGPYHQWTHKVRGKTVTLRVRPDEAKLLEEWIESGRRLDRIVAEMERVAYRLTERLRRAARGLQVRKPMRKREHARRASPSHTPGRRRMRPK